MTPLIIILVILYIWCLLIYNNPQNYMLYRQLWLKELEFLTFDYLKKNFSDFKIILSNSNIEDIKQKKVSIEKYINKHLNKTHWYFKTEDTYDFLDDIKLKKKILKTFRNSIKSKLVVAERLSFWMGGIGTWTSYHTDMEDECYLYIISGRKKIQLIHPKYTKKMFSKNEYFPFALWSNIDFKKIDLKKTNFLKDVHVEEIILEAGDCIYIPRNWWHSVENLEPTIAITYKIYRPHYAILCIIPEFFRFLYYLFLN